MEMFSLQILQWMQCVIKERMCSRIRTLKDFLSAEIYIGILGKSFVQYDFRTTFISFYGPERFGKLSI